MTSLLRNRTVQDRVGKSPSPVRVRCTAISVRRADERRICASRVFPRLSDGRVVTRSLYRSHTAWQADGLDALRSRGRSAALADGNTDGRPVTRQWPWQACMSSPSDDVWAIRLYTANCGKQNKTGTVMSLQTIFSFLTTAILSTFLRFSTQTQFNYHFNF
jgi:hypothetical protein